MALTNKIHTITQLIEDAARTFGTGVFISDQGKDYSFEDLNRLTRQVARALLASGVMPGQRIAVWAPNQVEWVLAAMGAQRVGIVMVPLNTRYKGSEAAQILNESQAKKLFCVGDFLGSYYPEMLAGQSLPHLEEVIVFGTPETAHGPKTDSLKTDSLKQVDWESFIQRTDECDEQRFIDSQASVKDTDVSDILFTSGTTGRPKGVMTCHRQNIQTFEAWSDLLGLSAGEKYLVISPFFHSFGYKAGVLAALIRGATVLPHQAFDSEDILKRIDNENIQVVPGPPTLFQSLLSHPKLAQYDISSLKRATTGAAVIPVQLIHQMKDQLGFEVVLTAYGLTESCGLATMCRPDDSAETIATTSGRAIDGVEVRCVDPQGNDVPEGEAGEIVVRGFNVMQGYFLDGEINTRATQEAIDVDGWLHTGDVGTLDHQGNLAITDRLKDMFINGGFNCYPAEIENIITTHPLIATSSVIGISDERLGEVAMAFVQLSPDQQLTEVELISWCRNNMANYKVPRKVAFVDTLPLNASGKVLKTELKAMAAAVSA